MLTFESINVVYNFVFWTPVDVTPLCFFRIVIGILLIINSLLFLKQNTLYFSSDGMGYMTSNLGKNRFSVYYYLPNYKSIDKYIVFFLLLTSICVTFGFLTRIMLGLCYFLLISLLDRNDFIKNGGDTVLRLFVFLLIFSNSHYRFSIDSMLIQFPDNVPAYNLRILQIFFSSIYIKTVLHKLKGVKWRNGSAVYYALKSNLYVKRSLPEWCQSVFVYRFLTYSTLIIEFLSGIGVWIAELRMLAIILGCMFHFFIFLFMGIGLFEWIMISGFILFLTPFEVNSLIGFLL